MKYIIFIIIRLRASRTIIIIKFTMTQSPPLYYLTSNPGTSYLCGPKHWLYTLCINICVNLIKVFCLLIVSTNRTAICQGNVNRQGFHNQPVAIRDTSLYYMYLATCIWPGLFGKGLVHTQGHMSQTKIYSSHGTYLQEI